MAAIFSVRFTAGTNTSSGLSFTVPAGKVAILRDVSGVLSAGSGTVLFVAINGINLAEIVAPPAGQSSSVQWRGRQVANAGEVIALGFAGSSGSAAASGYLLDA